MEAGSEKTVIVDAHCHIASLDCTPRSFVDGALDNLEVALRAQGLPVSRSKLFDTYEQRMHDDDCDELVSEMDDAGISRAVLLAADFTYVLEDCVLTVEETFARHAEVRRRHPGRLEVFGGVDPRWGKDGVALFERYVVEEGFSGLKIYPPCGYSPSDRRLFDYYEICAAHDIPVLMHIGPTSPRLAFEFGRPALADEACRAFPNVRFIMAHAAVSYTPECLMMAAYRPNVYLDISAFQASHNPVEAIAALTRHGVNHKILFGTDWPVFRMQGKQKSFVDKGMTALQDLTLIERCLILSRNAARLLPEDRSSTLGERTISTADLTARSAI